MNPMDLIVVDKDALGTPDRFIASCDAIMRSMVVLRLGGQLKIGPSGVFFQSNARTQLAAARGPS
jgi:hypothetical protein